MTTDAPTVAVIGGGAAGAAAAYQLQHLGHRVRVFEASGAVGGRTTTEQRGDFRVERGAIYMLNSYDRCVALAAEVGVDLERWSPLAALDDGRRLHDVRYDFLPTFLRLDALTLRDKARLVRKIVRFTVGRAPDPFSTDSLAEFDTGEDMESWSRREFGDAAFEYVVRPLIEPSFGTDARELSTPYLVGILKRAYKAKFTVPVDGMGALVAALLADHDVLLNAPVHRVSRAEGQGFVVEHGNGDSWQADAVVLAVDPRVSAGIAAEVLGQDRCRVLESVPFAAMSHVNLRWAEDPWPEDHREMILPVGPGPRDVLGLIVRRSATSTAVPVGGASIDAYLSTGISSVCSDEEAAESALTAVRAALGPHAAPHEVEVFTFPRALALCPPGHYAAMKALRDGLPEGLALAGDFLAHLGVETAVVSGEAAARSIAGSLRDRTASVARQ